MDNLEYNVNELAKEGGYLDRLQGLLGSHVKYEQTGGGSNGKKASKAPWAPQHAGPYFDILISAIRLEEALRTDLHGEGVMKRAHNHYQAKAALCALTTLAQKFDPDTRDAITRQVEKWVTMARYAPGVDEIRQYMRLETLCPFCHEQNMWVARDASSDVKCRTVGCVDPTTGTNPVWPKRTWVRLLQEKEDD